MFDYKKRKISRQPKRSKNNLRPPVLILGIFAVASLGIITFALLQNWSFPASAAPGIYKVLNYQGKLEDSGGVTVADGAYNIKFTIYDAAAAGNVLWTARESDACGAAFNPSAKSVTTSLGVFSTQLGESGDCPLNLDFNTDSYYLGITIGADSEMTPRKRIGAAGYAFNSDLLDGLNTSDDGGSTCPVPGACAYVPVTDSSGNLFLTANVTFDTTTFALDATNNNIGIGTATPDTNRTLDLTTSKKYGVYSETSSTTGSAAAVYGSSTATGGFSPYYGGYFTAAGDSGTAGVYGESTSAGGLFIENYGGYFTAAGGYDVAVKGYASGSTGVNYGGNFVASGPGGYGVKTWANDTSATANYGGYFRASGQGGYGVYGWAGETTVANYGGYFKSDGAGGYGIYSTATDATAVVNYGGYFTAAGTVAGATGVYALASGNASVYGVYGEATGTGAGVTNYGGYFTAAAGQARAVYAEATNAAGTASGVYSVARAASGTAVNGLATDIIGASNIGGNFEAWGDNGASGVRGTASGATGTNYGVYGSALSGYAVYGFSASATAWSGYFEGSRGLHADRLAVNDISAIAYNSIGTAAASHVAAGEIENASDLFIADDLEIDGWVWLDGGFTDLAEMVAYTGEGEAGDVIVIDKNYDNTAKIATEPYDQTVLGVISEKPSLIITGGIKEGKLLAVAGRIPTKVTNINGAIHRGDPLTTSSMPGYAMKATEAGPIVGKALGECDERECNIWVFLNISWFGGI